MNWNEPEVIKVKEDKTPERELYPFLSPNELEGEVAVEILEPKKENIQWND